MTNHYFESVSTWSWLIGITPVVLLYLINWYKRPYKSPPGPRGIPILGYLPLIGKKPHETAVELSKKYGPIISLQFGTSNHIFLNDFDSIHKALVKNGSTLSGRRIFPTIIDINNGDGIVSLDYGEKWKAQRKFGLHTLRGFGVGKKGMENMCLEELQYLNEEIRNKTTAFDISRLLHNAVSNNICQVVFGKRFEYDDEDFKKMLHVVIDTFDDPKTTFSNQVISFLPFLRHIPPISHYNKRFVGQVQSILDWVETIRKEHETTFDEDNIRDFVDAFILEQKKGKESSFTKSQLLFYVHDLFIAGTETTSSTLYWSLLCFLHYPETQDKLRKEVVQVIGSSGTISMSKKADMPYTNAFIQEIMRFRTLAPLSVPHFANEDTEIDGYIFRKNTIIHSNIWAVHNSPDLWKDPKTFNPERFLDEEGNFVKSNHVIPFSVGPRHCLGEQLARMEVFTFLVGLVQKFEFLPDPDSDELPLLNEEVVGLASVATPYKIVAKEL